MPFQAPRVPKRDDEKECDACHYPARELREYPSYGSGNVETKKLLCELCAHTMAGNAFSYPSQYKESYHAMMTINFGNNLILDILTDRRKETRDICSRTDGTRTPTRRGE